ncbi:transcription termination factor MTERF9, chloroplastic-like [Phragmites australis]|uniref:transcription termination factor MTERF9, chloroplastic-like n=1 Tax=Phragmites australis TaxID=29695 RepID=UPI002D7772D7|nr:transcription termination factor MTERF9, chloroplastic-like [Phragmites australis]
MLRLRNHLLPLLRAASLLPSPLHHRGTLLSTSASAAPFSLEDYLVATCGLAPAQARKAYQKALDGATKAKPSGELCYSRLNSASNPDAVLALLSGVGLARADIAAVVAADPLILRSSVKNIGPRLLALRDRFGLSAPQIARFLLVGSRALRGCDVGLHLEFLLSFYGSFEQLLVVMKRNNSILWTDLERVVKPNIALFRQCGLSVRDIVQMCSRCPWLLVFNPERVKEFVVRAEELGVPRSSRMFRHAVVSVASISKEKVAAKLEFLKRALGCAETEVAIAVSKMPSILGLSKECHLRRIQFLINEVGMEPQYIVERPVLFSLSLEKRLIPRHCVMKVLQANGLLNSNMSFFSLAKIREETFKLKFIDCHKDSVTGLADAYAAARAGGVPPKSNL